MAFNRNLFTSEAFTIWSQYTTGTRDYEIDKASHYVQLIKALKYWSLRTPTMKAMKNIIGITKGFPFAYEAGGLDHVVTGDWPTQSVEADIMDVESGQFTNNLGKWTAAGGGMTRNTTTYHTGIQTDVASMKIINDVVTLNLDLLSTTLDIGTEYRLVMYTYGTNGSDIMSIIIDYGNTVLHTVKTFSPTPSLWEQHTFDFTCNDIHPRLRIDVTAGSAIKTMFIDDISIQPLPYSEDRRAYSANINDQNLYFTNSGELSYVVSGYHNQFEILVDDFNIYDYISNAPVISGYADADTGADIRNVIVAQTNSGLINDFPFTTDNDFYLEWLNRALPDQLKFYEATI